MVERPRQHFDTNLNRVLGRESSLGSPSRWRADVPVNGYACCLRRPQGLVNLLFSITFTGAETRAWLFGVLVSCATGTSMRVCGSAIVQPPLSLRHLMCQPPRFSDRFLLCYVRLTDVLISQPLLLLASTLWTSLKDMSKRGVRRVIFEGAEVLGALDNGDEPGG